MQYTKRELDCMQLARTTTYRGRPLPSLRDECGKRKLDQQGSGNELRRRLKRFKAHQAQLEPLLCPVCGEHAAVEELFSVCAEQHHHLCFTCILGIVRQPPRARRCPMRCGALRVARLSPLVRDMAQPLLRDVVVSRAYRTYQLLLECGMVSPELTVDNLQFVSTVLRHPDLMLRATAIQQKWNDYTSAVDDLTKNALTHLPRHTPEEDDTEEDSDSSELEET